MQQNDDTSSQQLKQQPDDTTIEQKHKRPVTPLDPKSNIQKIL